MVGIGHAKYDVSKDEGHFSMENVRGFDIAMVWRIPCCQRSLRKVGNVSVADGSALVQRNYRFVAEPGCGHPDADGTSLVSAFPTGLGP